MAGGESKQMYSRVELAEGFRKLGVIPGDAVLLHA